MALLTHSWLAYNVGWFPADEGDQVNVLLPEKHLQL